MSGAELSREELLALVEQQARMIEALTARVTELERQLGRNSSQPPRQVSFPSRALGPRY